MIEIVDQYNRHLFLDELQDMYRMRHRAAVQEMGWSIEVDSQKRDIDDFDYPDTVYILYFNPDGSVGGCGRLNPTTRPHLLSEVFPQQCIDGVPQSSDVWEYSRYLIERKGKSHKEYMRAWMLITQAVNEWCIDNRVKQVTWLALKRLYGLSTALWSTRPLGPALYYPDDDKEYIAAISKMDRDGLKRVQKYSKCVGRISHYRLENQEAS